MSGFFWMPNLGITLDIVLLFPLSCKPQFPKTICVQDRWVTVEFQNVSGWVPKSFKPPSMVPNFGIQKKPDKEKDLRQILFGLTGVYQLGAPVQVGAATYVFAVPGLQTQYVHAGTCDPGSVLALMVSPCPLHLTLLVCLPCHSPLNMYWCLQGPSGSGKTSLLSVLGGRTPP